MNCLINMFNSIFAMDPWEREVIASSVHATKFHLIGGSDVLGLRQHTTPHDPLFQPLRLSDQRLVRSRAS